MEYKEVGNKVASSGFTTGAVLAAYIAGSHDMGFVQTAVRVILGWVYIIYHCIKYGFVI